MGQRAVSASVTAEDTFSPSLGFDVGRKLFNVSVAGVFTAKVTVQRSYDNGITWHNVKQYIAPAEEVGEFTEEGVEYRIGVLTGDFTSATPSIELRLSY